MKIIDYCILESDRPAGLELQVKSYLKEGWQPLDRILITSSGYSGTKNLYQKMVKYAPDKLDPHESEEALKIEESNTLVAAQISDIVFNMQKAGIPLSKINILHSLAPYIMERFANFNLIYSEKLAKGEI